MKIHENKQDDVPEVDPKNKNALFVNRLLLAGYKCDLEKTKAQIKECEGRIDRIVSVS